MSSLGNIFNICKLYEGERDIVNIDNNELIFDDGKYKGETGKGINTRRPHGKGIWTGDDGKIHDGLWKDGFAEGHGIVTYSRGQKYEGNFEKGNREGKGCYETKNWVYNGDWKKNKMEGEGIMEWKREDNSLDGRKYEGPWLNGRMHGKKGRFTYSNGDIYIGPFFKGKKHGRGIILVKEGGIYEGDWIDDNAVGAGTFKKDGKFISIGNWKENGKVNNDDKNSYNLSSIGKSKIIEKSFIPGKYLNTSR